MLQFIKSSIYKIKFLFLTCMLFIGVLANGQFRSAYYVVQYLKVHPTLENEYIKLETDVWKKMQEARIEAGVLDGWYLFRVISPSGTKTEYNYVTILQYNDAEKLAGHFESYGVDYTKLLTSEEIAFALRTPQIRDLVYEEVWQSVDQIMKPNAEKMFRFQVFNAMKLNQGTTDEEYQEMELKYWKAMHLKRMEMGNMHGWSMLSMIIPGGTERAYRWATVDFYDSFIDIMQDNDPILMSIFGEKESEKIIEKTETKRDLLRAEIRELMDFANSESIENR